MYEILRVHLCAKLLWIHFICFSYGVSHVISSSFESPDDIHSNFENAGFHNITLIKNNVFFVQTLEARIINKTLRQLRFTYPGSNNVKLLVDLQPYEDLWDNQTVRVIKDDVHGQNYLEIGDDSHHCHYRSVTSGITASVSHCRSPFLDGMIIVKNHVFILDRTNVVVQSDMEVLKDAKQTNHLKEIRSRIIKNTTEVQKLKRRKRSFFDPVNATGSFCGARSQPKKNEIDDGHRAIHAAVHNSNGWIWWQNLIVELAIFIDQSLWQKFEATHGNNAGHYLQDFVSTTLNNVQIFYQHSSFSPKVAFKVVRFEILKSQPYEMRGITDAETYLNAFCSYQSRWGGRNWDHALLFTGEMAIDKMEHLNAKNYHMLAEVSPAFSNRVKELYIYFETVDIVRHYTDYSISGIAKMSGVCDPMNSCLIAEAMDFRAAFITAHEIGHGLGISHDEQFSCGSSFIMSESLGGGKVVWSSCSVNEFQKYLNQLNNQNSNCMLVQNERTVLNIQGKPLPGKTYDGNKQCQMVFGKDYLEYKGRYSSGMGSDVCHMMWCHHRQGGNLLSSHPALEGTSCGSGYHCIGGKCVYGASIQSIPVDGSWSSWSPPNCQSCRCSTLTNGIALSKSVRSCNSPPPSNGGRDCHGTLIMALVCNPTTCSPTTNRQFSLGEYLNWKCSQVKSRTKNGQVVGTGEQISYSYSKACKIFCHLYTPSSNVKNFRFFGDSLPDGTPCGYDKYCVDGECLSLACDGRILSPDEGINCETMPQNCLTRNYSGTTQHPLQQKSKSTWTAWSAWSLCSATCGTGFKTRTRQCYDVKSYRKAKHCDGIDAEKQSCSDKECGLSNSNLRKRFSTSTTDWFKKGELWSSWSPCSVTCGEGTQRRYRSCYAFYCSGEKEQDRPCYPGQCTTWGGWGYWSSCGYDRTRRRVRQCYGDLRRDVCPGASLELEYC